MVIDWSYIIPLGKASEFILSHLPDRIMSFFQRILERRRRIITTPNGKQIQINGTLLSIAFGRLEEIGVRDRRTVCVLSANDTFDDECFDDQESSSGAFISRHFQGAGI